MCPKNWGQYRLYYIPMLYGVFIEYSQGIHGVFICIGYVSVMYRLCVGYVSEHIACKGVLIDKRLLPCRKSSKIMLH